MCTAAELQDDEARGTGCAMDVLLAWSSTACGSGSYLVVHASSTSDETKCSETSDDERVRCCADVFDSESTPALEPIFEPPTLVALPPTAAEVSVSSCDALGWTNGDEYGSPSVCGESDAGLGGCSGLRNWDEAHEFCESSGARLCTANELYADEAKDTVVP